MEQTLRWFGPDDGVSLSDIRQAGATAVVHALHHIANGEVWSVDEIKKRQSIIENAGLKWSVVESVPVHEDIKTGQDSASKYIDNYKTTISNLGTCGIETICYNFMPVIDWTRTDLDMKMPDGSSALAYNHIAFVAFEIHILKRPGAENDYSDSEKDEAQTYFKNMSADEIKTLAQNILAGLAGSEESYTLGEFQTVLDSYKNIDEAQLKKHLFNFLAEIIPVAEKANVKMAIHPDDPPRKLLGLPRIVSNESDLDELLKAVDSASNGLTLCVGSLASCENNNINQITKRFLNRVNFVHLRNIKRCEKNPKNFYESDHLDGEIDMFEVVSILNKEERVIPMRPDHGHKMIDDQNKKTNPGYSCIGRLRGLAELRGLEMAISRSTS